MVDVATGRTSVDLLQLPLAFSQVALLTPTSFQSACSERGLDLSLGRLEALHRDGLLVPRYAVDYGARATGAIRRAAGGPTEVHPGLVQINGSVEGLRRYYSQGRLADAAHLRFAPWSTATVFQGRRYQRYRYLYSPHQLLRIPDLRQVRWRMRRDRHGGITARVERSHVDALTRPAARQMDDVSWALDALASVYRPDIVGSVSVPPDGSRAWYTLYDSRDPAALLAWLGWPAAQVRDRAEWLLIRARGLDPLRDWLDLVRQVSPSSWHRLRGDALVALDMRIAAEVLLVFYDELVERGVADPIPSIPARAWHPILDRLGRRGHELDRVLTEFGLSPHPSVVLVVEGETERRLLPLALDLLGGTDWRRVVEVVDGKGADTNLEILAAFAVAPRLGRSHGRLVELDRPPARLVVVTDPEGARATPRARKRLRRAWVKRLYDSVPDEHRTPRLCRELYRLVELLIWDDVGHCFEFANFTDGEIGDGILSLAAFEPPPDRGDVLETVADCRARHLNLKRVWREWPGREPSKVALADALWPVMEGKLRKDPDGSKGTDIPLRRVAARILQSAYGLRRSQVVLRI